MYYQGSSETQVDGLQTLYLMNPNFVGYSDSDNTTVQKPANMLLFNSATNTAEISHAPLPQSHHFVGVPLSAAVGSPNSNYHNHPTVQEIQATHGAIPRVNYNLWKSVDQTGGGNEQNLLSVVTNASETTGGSSLRPERQGLSLTLTAKRGVVCDEVNNLQSVILGSKYLKAAQQLLDELVVVGKGGKSDGLAGEAAERRKIIGELSTTAGLNVEGLGSKGCESELTTAQRQEIQMKKAKLINMLDEVDLRYRQYHQQMQIVVASFEMAAGIGSARSYTQLALKTISKQFRCLRDSISMQIKALSKNLGEAQKFEGSRLKLVDHQLRQQRALQQIGMMQNNSAWRPQRGLPERAVSILRAWLFENFLHPYPKDTDKHILAKQTGLTRSQVSNWFINARVRLWKPMVEEMYVEEMKNSESNTSEENTTKTRMNTQENKNSSSKIEEIGPEKSPKKPRISPINTTPMQTETKGLPGDNYLSLMAANTSHGNRFGNYAIEELGRFNGADQLGTRFRGNNVFLTLGLPPSENNKLGSRNDDSHSNIGYHDHQMVDFQNTKPFSAQLLSDFVA